MKALVITVVNVYTNVMITFLAHVKKAMMHSGVFVC